MNQKREQTENSELFAHCLRSIIREIQEARRMTRNEVFERISQQISDPPAISRVMKISWTWSPETIRTYTYPSRVPKNIPQQFLDMVTGIYYNMIGEKKVNYPLLIDFYKSQGLTIDKDSIDSLGNAERDRRRFIDNFYSFTNSYVSTDELEKRLIKKIEGKVYNSLINLGVTPTQIEKLRFSDKSIPTPLLEEVRVFLRPDLDLEYQVSQLRLRERIRTQRRFSIWVTCDDSKFLQLFFYALIFHLSAMDEKIGFLPLYPLHSHGNIFVPYFISDAIEGYLSEIMPELDRYENMRFAFDLHSKLWDGDAIAVFLEKFVMKDALPEGSLAIWPKTIMCFYYEEYEELPDLDEDNSIDKDSQ